ncbi:hypothetical protein INT45_002539 [Circinella minor]|uniref:Uncharacterized protein n=1 Tax=Circinella minor TaxID=1195481 RepID=A0A8H7RYN5_9FUNG|nr:hypothetical protein INT45_002539 [Circinella minor]
MMTNNNISSSPLSEQQQLKSILDKLQLLNTDPPLFFAYFNDVDLVSRFVSAITIILTLTPRALRSSTHIDDSSHVILSLSNAASLLSFIVEARFFVNSNGGKQKITREPTMETTMMPKNNNSKSNSNGLSRTVGKAINNSSNRKHRQKVPATTALPEWSKKIAGTIKCETNAILSYVDSAKNAIQVSSSTLYNKIAAAGCFEEEYEGTSARSVHLALIAHTHRLVDAILAFNGSTTEGEWIARSKKHNDDTPHRQHQVVNGQLGTGTVFDVTYRRSEDLPKSNKQQQQHHGSNRSLKRKSVETAGSRFMRSISSSFRNSSSSSTKSPSLFDHETSPRSSKSSNISFGGSPLMNDENDLLSSRLTVKIKPEDNSSSISVQSRSTTSTSTTNTSSSSPKSAIRTFFGSASTIVRHGRDHQISPTSKKASIIPKVTKQLNHHNPSSQQNSTVNWRHLFTSTKNNNNENKGSKYENNNNSILMMDGDNSKNSSMSSNLDNHQLSFTTDHITETRKLYSPEQHRWSCGDNMKYSASEISKYNSNYSFYGINSRKLLSEQRKRERYAATLRLKENLNSNNKNNNSSSSNDNQQQIYPKTSTIFRQDTPNNDDGIDAMQLSSSIKTDSNPDSILVNNEKYVNNIMDQHSKAHQDYYYQTIHRRSLSDDDDELEMLTMGTYGPLTPISVLDSPTLLPCEPHSSSIASLELRQLSNEETVKDATNMSSKTIVEPSSLTEPPKAIVANSMEIKNSKYATISSTNTAMHIKDQQQYSSSTLLNKAMVLTESRTSLTEELRPSQHLEHQEPTPSYRSVGTIGKPNISSVFSRHHWSPHKITSSIQGDNKGHAKTLIPQQLHQRRNPIPFSTFDDDINNNPNRSPTETSLSINTFRDTLYRSLEMEIRANLDYVDTYLLSHQAFISSSRLFEKLEEIFQHNVCHEYGAASQRSIQLRVINVISRWIKLQYEDFRTDNNLLNRLYRFLNNNVQVAHLAEDLATIKNLLEIQNIQQEKRFFSTNTEASLPRMKSTESLERGSINNHSPRPYAAREFYTPGASTTSSSHAYSSSSTFKKGSINALALSSTSSALTSLDANDVAQYLTLADFNILKNITPYEYLKGTWRSNKAKSNHYNSNRGKDDNGNGALIDSKKGGYTKILTRRANMLSHWVLHEVCSPENSKQRRMIIRKLIHIAKLCIEWNNFHTGMIIVMGLQCPIIQRLENTWHALPSRDINTFNTLQKYLDVTNNMGFYRQSLATAKAPVVPFFPLILKDLTFFMDGNPTLSAPSPLMSQQRLEPLSTTQHPYPKLINFDKFRVLTQFVNTLMNYTTVNYWFACDLEHCPFLPHISITRPTSSSQLLTSDVPILDRVAELVEIKIRSVESCYEDSKCSNQWVSSTNIRKMGK